MREAAVSERCDTSGLKPGEIGFCSYNITNGTIVTTTGIGGYSIRDFADDDYHTQAHWASTYATEFGALFCKYNVDGNPRLAYCYFKDLQGNTVDEFWMTRDDGSNVE